MTSDLVTLTQDMVRILRLSGNEGEVANLIAQRMRAAGSTQVSTDRNGSVRGLRRTC